VADPGGRWAGALSVPHALRLDGDRLVVEPHPAVAHAVQDVRPGSTRWVGDTEVRLAGDELSVRSDREAFTVPCAGGPVRILVDPPIVEVFGPAGVAGFVTSAPQNSLPD
jgi:beta-fructofuranosidase